MKAWVDLFSTDYGLASLAVILITLGIGAFMYRMVTKAMDESAEAEKRKSGQ